MLEKAVTLAEIKMHQEEKTWIEEKMISTEELFKNSSEIILNDKELERFLNGVKLKIETKEKMYYRIYNQQRQFVGIGKSEENTLKRDVIL